MTYKYNPLENIDNIPQNINRNIYFGHTVRDIIFVVLYHFYEEIIKSISLCITSLLGPYHFFFDRANEFLFPLYTIILSFFSFYSESSILLQEIYLHLL